MGADPSRPPMTFQQQAELLEYICKSCRMASDGQFATLTITHLDKQQIEDLRATAARLYRMAPYEREIKKLVTGR